MRLPAPLLAPLAVLLAAAAAAAQDSCVKCHSGLEGKPGEAVRLSARDIHFRRGLTCTACHGGDGAAPAKEQAHDPARGYRGAPRGTAVLDACGRCHSDPSYMRDFNPTLRVDQVALYRESHHGRKLLAGDAAAATCTSCHGHHGMVPPSDPASPVFPLNVPTTCGKCHEDRAIFGPRGIPTDAVEKYRGSVHGKALLGRADLAAPACNSCHGNHGATPPQVASVANVCGTCHSQQADLFRASPKKAIFDANDMAECVFCHSHHAIRPPRHSMLGVGPESTCIQCHVDEDDDGWRAAKRLEAAFLGARGKIDTAAAVLGRAEQAGMEVSDPQFRLSEARDHFTEARVLVHGFDPAAIQAKLGLGEAIAVEARGEGEMALAEIDFRRRGLYVSLVAIALLALGLWFKVRQVDREHPPREEGLD